MCKAPTVTQTDMTEGPFPWLSAKGAAMWRTITAAIILVSVAGCSAPKASAPQPSPLAVVDATPLDDLVKTIVADEAQAASLCLAGKTTACSDRDYAIRSLNERGYCQRTTQSAWSKCQKAATSPLASR